MRLKQIKFLYGNWISLLLMDNQLPLDIMRLILDKINGSEIANQMLELYDSFPEKDMTCVNYNKRDLMIAVFQSSLMKFTLRTGPPLKSVLEEVNKMLEIKKESVYETLTFNYPHCNFRSDDIFRYSKCLKDLMIPISITNYYYKFKNIDKKIEYIVKKNIPGNKLERKNTFTVDLVIKVV